MRLTLAELDGRAFDVVIIGAGVNGASAAQHLSAAGYQVLVVDKGDFASGSSSRSSRLVHCGLRYLAPGSSLWEFVRHPNLLAVALRMAKRAMEARAQFVTATPERVRPMKFLFPLYKNGPYAAWQIDLAFKILAALGPRSMPIEYRRLAPSEVSSTPLAKWLRDPQQLSGVATFCEYQFEWPERICIDTLLDAERMGAVVRNYTPVTKLDAQADKTWKIALADALSPGAAAAVTAKAVLNTAGIWIDQVNARTGATPRRRILGTKGVHVMVRLPPECGRYGIATLNRVKEPFYCVPWRGLHYFGPTETVYEGDLEDIRPLDDEVEWIIDEANYLLPSLRLRRSDVLFAWAGVRPLTYDKTLPKGKRSREIHDFASEGLPNFLAMSAGPVMTLRSGGIELTEAVRARVPPSRPPQTLSYAARLFPQNLESPPLLEDYKESKMSDLRFAAEHEYPASLVDLLFRRTGAAWTATMAADAAERAAAAVADIMGWDPARVNEESRRYRAYLADNHLLNPAAPTRRTER